MEHLEILLVEDNPGDVRLIQEMLAEASEPSFRLKCANRLATGLEHLALNGTDVVLLDLSLPDSHGLETFTRAHTQAPGIPIVVLTGSDDEKLAVNAVQAGAQDYLVKGRVDGSLLVRSIRYAIERERASEALRQLQDQFRQAQKMEAVGRLAGGVAHDFNNMLAVILGYTDLLLVHTNPSDAWREWVEIIQESVHHAATLTRQLLIFSHRQVLAPQVLDLNEQVAHMKDLLQRLIGEDIELRTDLAPEPARVRTDPVQIGQVIMNLAVNARDAMPRGGTLTLATARVQIDSPRAGRRLEAPPGSYVMLAVSDTGCGMDTATQSHLFEPFFTTKEPGKGTGLGLATVYGIVKQSGGHIEVRSEPGEGATFQICLPWIEDAVSSVETLDAETAPAAGSETILLVEDEPRMLQMMRAVLQTGGYTILEAGQAHAALEICEQHQGPIHLLVTDMVMPGLNGSELAARMAALRPDVKVLFISGYLDRDTSALSDGQEESVPFLQKPFKPAVLARTVREVLGGGITG